MALGLALFAATYRSTLLEGQRDQAAFALPLDLRVREDLGHLVAPTEAAPLAAYGELGSGLRVEPVARVAASTSNLGGLQLVGIDADAIGALGGWRDDFAYVARGALIGWTRVRGGRPPESFDARGRRLPDPKDPAAAVPVAYPLSRAEDGRLVVEEIDAARF